MRFKQLFFKLNIVCKTYLKFINKQHIQKFSTINDKMMLL